MNSFPKLYRNWLTKQVADFSGTNLQQTYWSRDTDEQSRSPLCPCCQSWVESTMHMTRCPSPGRREMYELTVRSLINWMADTQIDPVLVQMVREYLLAQGSKTMQECLAIENEEYSTLAEVTDKLRWDCFLEGRIASQWIEVVTPQLKSSNLYLTPTKWGQQFIEQLLSITHKQWIFRNSKVHLRKLDGLTEDEHKDIFQRMEDLMFTNPDDLLPAHKHLLEEDFEGLGEGSAITRQYWIADMESAISAAERVHQGHVVPGSMPRFNTTRKRRTFAQRRQSGSIVYRRRSRGPKSME